MNTKAWKVRSIVAASACVLLLGGCGANSTSDNGGGAPVSASPSAESTATATATTPVIPTPSPEAPKQDVSVYVTDEQLTELIERIVTIEYTAELDLVQKAIAALQENDGTNISLWHEITVDSVKLEDGIATIDISFPDEARFGAPGELMLIDSLKQTLFQFSFVDGIDVLVQGEQVESVMGHVDLDHPMVRE